MDDTELAASLAVDLDGTFERLVRAYQDGLYRFGFRLSGSSQDAEEIAQDAFVRAYHALLGYSPERIRSLAVRPWLYRIALNVFHNRVRVHRVRTVPLEHDPGSPDGHDGPERQALDRERRNEIGALLEALPLRYRVPVVLRHVEDLSYAEISESLDQPVGTVKANVHRGLRLLRDAMTNRTVGVPA